MVHLDTEILFNQVKVIFFQLIIIIIIIRSVLSFANLGIAVGIASLLFNRCVIYQILDDCLVIICQT